MVKSIAGSLAFLSMMALASSSYARAARALSVQPSVGEMFFNEEQRSVAGAFATAPIFETTRLTLAPSLGFLYGGLGNTVAGNTSADESVIQIPLTLRLSVRPDPLPRLSVGPHVGVNFVHTPSGLNGTFGSSPILSSNAQGSGSWNTHPAVGGDLDYAITRGVAVGIRYDSTLMSAFNLQTLTLEIGVVL